MVNEDRKINPALKKYIITFKPKRQRVNKRDDKVEILKHITGLGDFENYVNLSDLRIGDKFHRYNKSMSSGRNETDRFNPIVPNTETIHDINRYNFPVVMLKLSEEHYHKVRKDPNVLMVEEDSNVYPHMSTGPAPPQQTPYGITRVKAPDAWTSMASRNGDGVIVGIVDSGIADHPDLQDNEQRGASFVSATANWDDEGMHIGTLSSPLVYHGTHNSGIVAAIDNQEGVVGVAPKALLYGIRIFSPTVLQTTQTVIIAAMEWAMNNGVDVVNNSWGDIGTFTTAIQTQFQQAYDQGMIIVASAGNDGVKTMDPSIPTGKQNYPSGYDSVIEVSAMDAQDQIATFSNYGKKTEYAAPGVLVLSTWLTSQFGGYNALSGTSAAAPHVSGMFALGLSAWRFSPCSDLYALSTKKNEVLRMVARTTADKMGKFADRDPNNAYGYGVPNCDAFVKKLLNPDIHVKTVA